MYLDIPGEIVVKKITAKEEEEESEVACLVGNRESGCSRDETQRYFLFQLNK